MLRDDTGKLWEKLKSFPELAGFVLIGGSALSLQIRHRYSEDLDFAWPHGKLPRAAIDQLIAQVPYPKFVLDQNEADEREASDCGLELADYKQDYLVGNVRVTFYASRRPAELSLLEGGISDPLRVATVNEIFILKALTCADRSKSRDWFDLYTLFTKHNFTWAAFREAYTKYSSDFQYENAAGRMCSGEVQPDDEGYKQLVDDPPSPEAMRDYFISLRSSFEKASQPTINT
jgi:predicted nucleotidyltransferase component of viral defense system